MSQFRTPLPASCYTDPVLLAREHDRIFRRTWQYVARIDQLERVGNFVAGEAADVPVVVVHGDGGLRAFVNVCRHRRHLVVTGSGNRKTLRCPYHAWAYDLEGCLRAAPRAERERLQTSELSLLPLRVEAWGGFVFVNLDQGARPLTDFLGNLPAHLADHGPDLGQLEFRCREEWRTAANWKVMIENYLECYHCPVAHPGFSTVVDVAPAAYQLAENKWFSVQSGPLLASGPAAPDHAVFYYLWPNLTINVHPGPANLSIDVFLPDGPENTKGITDYYFGANVSEAEAAAAISFSRQVRDEDDALVQSVQRGLRAGTLATSRLLPQSERLLIHFQKLFTAAMESTLA